MTETLASQLSDHLQHDHPDTPMIAMYLGERVDKMSRERLIEVVCDLGQQLERTREYAAESSKRTFELLQAVLKRVKP